MARSWVSFLDTNKANNKINSIWCQNAHTHTHDGERKISKSISGSGRCQLDDRVTNILSETQNLFDLLRRRITFFRWGMRWSEFGKFLVRALEFVFAFFILCVLLVEQLVKAKYRIRWFQFGHFWLCELQRLWLYTTRQQVAMSFFLRSDDGTSSNYSSGTGFVIFLVSACFFFRQVLVATFCNATENNNKAWAVVGVAKLR